MSGACAWPRGLSLVGRNPIRADLRVAESGARIGPCRLGLIPMQRHLAAEVGRAPSTTAAALQLWHAIVRRGVHARRR